MGAFSNVALIVHVLNMRHRKNYLTKHDTTIPTSVCWQFNINYIKLVGSN